MKMTIHPFVVDSSARQKYKKAISDYQESVADPEGLNDLGSLPENRERHLFRKMFANCWEPTMTLVEEVRDRQARRRRASFEQEPGP